MNILANRYNQQLIAIPWLDFLANLVNDSVVLSDQSPIESLHWLLVVASYEVLVAPWSGWQPTALNIQPSSSSYLFLSKLILFRTQIKVILKSIIQYNSSKLFDFGMSPVKKAFSKSVKFSKIPITMARKGMQNKTLNVTITISFPSSRINRG